MSDHSLQVHAPKRFECDICKKRASTRWKIRSHILYAHAGGDKQYKCVTCQKWYELLATHVKFPPFKPFPLRSYSTENKLHLHLRYVHEGAGRAVCHICGKKYQSAASLSLHLQNHSDVKTPIFCDSCGKSFKNERGMLRHKEWVHHNQSQPFQCPKCPRISPNRNALSRHISTMHNSKVYKCQMCDREFKRTVALKV